jgi:hypothetical protein
MHTNLYLENLKGRDYTGDMGISESMVVEQVLKKQSLKMWNGFSWLMIRITVGLP